MSVVVVTRDLVSASRIDEAARRRGVSLTRVDEPAAIPAGDDVAVVFANWEERSAGWGQELAAWRDAVEPGVRRVVLFGPHAVADGRDEARRYGLGPVVARSRVLTGAERWFGPGDR